jgi:diaminobutyrate acetyltransferase
VIEISNESGQLIFRKTEARDGPRAWQLVKDTGVLDLNSAYAYIVLCDYFSDTCAIAEEAGQAVGFVSAFRDPRDPSVLFIWQVAVDAARRGEGIALRMIRHVLQRASCRGVRTIELTIAPTNRASQGLFRKLARALGCEVEVRKGYEAAMFPGGAHEDEDVYRIGPLP